MERGWRTFDRQALLEREATRYQQASAPEKKQILAQFVAKTGYVRKYAVWVLHHAQEILQAAAVEPEHYGPEVREALVLAWETLDRICAKRLVPFLPDIISSLELNGHLQLSEESRRLLLSMSAATADRLLRPERSHGLRSLSTTKAGSLLKQQISIRTFEDWNETKPGFLEVDLVAHCGSTIEGSFLYTLTLTDVATEWTECLPLLNRGREEVLAALQRACSLFPFPILGIDTDNGGEFINEEVAAYCTREQITFTRGRPYEKRDQCFIEQKNRVVVRRVVGRHRLEGEHAARQLTELYRALRLYVNCFQPSMKLVAKTSEGHKVCRVYDPAKTPLQRLLLSGVLPVSQQHELQAVARALDPLRLFQLLQHLQQAVFRCAMGSALMGRMPPVAPLLVFEAQHCTTGLPLPNRIELGEAVSSLQHASQELQSDISVLNWRRTCKDPFAGQWEQILALVQADPTRTSGDLFRELQALFPGRYQPLQIRTLQRGLRKIRAHLLTTREEQWQQELIHGTMPAAQSLREEPRDSSPPMPSADSSLETTSVRSCPPLPPTEAQLAHAQGRGHRSTKQVSASSKSKKNLTRHTALARRQSDGPVPSTDHGLTIEEARGGLPCSPVEVETFPRTACPRPHVMQPEAFEQWVQAAFPQDVAPKAKKVVLRDRALLWVLFDTGISVKEVCALQVSDLDHKMETVRVRGKSGQERQAVVGQTCLEQVLSWLQSRAQPGRQVAEKSSNELLFCTMDGYPLTQNSITLLFRRLRIRAGMPETAISPRLLRQSFALRYLQAGGNPCGLQELLGYTNMVSVKPYLRWHEQFVCDGVQKSVEEEVGEVMRYPGAGPFQPQAGRREEATGTQATVTSPGVQTAHVPNQEPRESNHTPHPAVSRLRSGQRGSTMTIERAIQEYVEALRRRKRQPKTLEWHQTALALFQQYLQQECACAFVDQVTPSQVRGWFTYLQETPTGRCARRAAGTIESYARSARAFCQWLVLRRVLKRTPFADLQMPIVEPSPPHLLEPQAWESLLQACRSPREQMPGAEQATARNQALLWVLAETGMRASEVCGLRLFDLDREQGLLRVKGKGSRARWVPMKPEGLRHLLVYVDQYRLEEAKREQRKRVGEEPLFVSETGRTLTENGIALLFGRLRKRAGITRKDVNPTLLRDSFAVRYLQTGGDLFTLRELLGQEESAVVKRALRMREKLLENAKCKEH